jgi:hypothetical protein
MGNKFDKAVERLKTAPTDYTYTEARNILIHLGFTEYTKGKTSGSRMKFYRVDINAVILLHKPHPGDVMNIAAVKQLRSQLIDLGLI